MQKTRHSIFPHFKRFIDERGLFRKGDGIVAAVSGGVDSMLLIHLLKRFSTAVPVRLFVAHVNYGLRGKESNADERLVREVSSALGLECFVKRARLRQNENLQDLAREVRYKFFEEVADRNNASVIATAHHMDDQAETLLLHIIRGSGLAGLSGMRPRFKKKKITIVRPLLFATKKEILAAAESSGIEYRTDATNLLPKYSRNALRHLLLPELAKHNPRIVHSLAALAERAFIDNEALDLTAHEAFSQIASESSKERVALRRREYAHLPEGLRRRVLRIAFEELTGSAKDLNADQLKRMDEIALGVKGNASYRLPAGCKFERFDKLLAIIH